MATGQIIQSSKATHNETCAMNWDPLVRVSKCSIQPEYVIESGLDREAHHRWQ